MRTNGSLKVAVLCWAAGCVTAALAQDVEISRVTVRQRWPWSRLADIDYVLNADPTQRVDIALTAFNGSEALTIPSDALSGDLFSVSEGARRIVLDPALTPYTNSEVLTRFRVELTPTPVPEYMVIDLTKSAGDAGQIEYLYEADLTSGGYGSVETNPVSGIASIVWTGVTNNSAYKDQKLVLRRIHSGSVTNLSNETITVSKDYFISVFELTQHQWYRVMGAYPVCKFSDKNGPVEKTCNYDALRGSAEDGIDWPTTGHSVAPGSFIAAVRDLTRIAGFDLPDNEQWQYACRAGTSTLYHDNDYSATTAEVSGTNAWLHVLGCYHGNAGGTTAPVGSFKPNAFGLYDMHGNVMEWTLNYYSGSSRTRRGGSYYYEAARCTSAFGREGDPADSDSYGMNGARLVINY